MTTDIKFSIIIALYNHDDIDTAIETVTNQTYKNYEIVVVDDCTPDKDYSYLSNKYENLKFIRATKNGGPGVTRQIGLDNATGDWVLFLDQDDALYDENVLSLIHKKCMEYPEAQVFEFGFIAIIPASKDEDDDSTTTVIPEKSDMRPLHGFVFRHKFIIDNDIRFHHSLRWHEDAYFFLTWKCLVQSNYDDVDKVWVKLLDDIIYAYYNVHLDKSITHRMYGIYTFFEVSLFDHITLFSDLYERLKGKVKEEYLEDLLFSTMINLMLGYVVIFECQSLCPFYQRNLLRVRLFAIKVFDLLAEKYNVHTPEEIHAVIKTVADRWTFNVYPRYHYLNQGDDNIFEVLKKFYDIYLQDKQTLL